MSFEIQHFPPQESQYHADTIHHVEYDYYGKRMATCSSDKTVCIWDRTPDGWVKTAYWKRHGSAVWRVRFAHPEFGQILATCSFDSTVNIFDKDASESADQISHAGFHMGRGDATNGWSRHATLNGYGNILDIAFTPPCYGLRLAGCTSNGKVMIWEADDVMTTDIWNNSFCLDIGHFRLSSLSWSSNRSNLALLAVSSDSTKAPEDERVTLVMFNFNVGYGTVKVARHKFEFKDQVRCVQFGPSLGLSHHKLAVAAGTKIHIYHIQVAADEGKQTVSFSQHTASTPNVLPEFEATKLSSVVLGEVNSQFLVSQVVRISWNVLGDVISAVYADGMTRIWKYSFANKWIQTAEIPPPESPADFNHDNVYY